MQVMSVIIMSDNVVEFPSLVLIAFPFYLEYEQVQVPTFHASMFKYKYDQ